MAEFKSIAQHAIESAKKYGVQNAFASITRSQDLNVSWRKGQIEDISSAGGSVLRVHLFVDGRFGSFRSSDLRHESMDESIRDAIQMTRLLEEEPARTLPDPSLYENRADIDLELYDPTVAQLTPNNLIEKCGILEAECQKTSDLSISDIFVTYGIKLNESYKINTNGFEGVQQESSVSGACIITVKDGEKKIMGSKGHYARFCSDLHKPEYLAREAAQNCRYRVGATKLSSKVRTILIDRQISNFLYNYLSPLDGYSFLNKQSYFIDKIGQNVGSSLLDLHDMPFIKRGFSSQLFDSEGISSKERTIIDHGKLIYVPVDTYYANKLGIKQPTGNTSNVVLTPGKRSREEMIADIKDGIYVLQLIGGNSDTTQGDFSYGIFGVAIEDGKLTKNVSEMNISGNFLELWKNLTEVGNDPNDNSNYIMPTLRFDNVSTSGS